MKKIPRGFLTLSCACICMLCLISKSHSAQDPSDPNNRDKTNCQAQLVDPLLRAIKIVEIETQDKILPARWGCKLIQNSIGQYCLALPKPIYQIVRSIKIRSPGMLLDMYWSFPEALSKALGWTIEELQESFSELKAVLDGHLNPLFFEPPQFQNQNHGALTPLELLRTQFQDQYRHLMGHGIERVEENQDALIVRISGAEVRHIYQLPDTFKGVPVQYVVAGASN